MAEQVVPSQYGPAKRRSWAGEELTPCELNAGQERGRMGRRAMPSTQPLLAGGSSWQGWEPLAVRWFARGGSAGEDDPGPAEKQPLLLLQSPRRCLNIASHPRSETVPFANAGWCVCGQLGGSSACDSSEATARG